MSISPYRWRLEEAAKRNIKRPLMAANAEHNWAMGQLRRMKYAAGQISDSKDRQEAEAIFERERLHRIEQFEALKKDILDWQAKQEEA